jgi:hypothetical protein
MSISRHSESENRLINRPRGATTTVIARPSYVARQRASKSAPSAKDLRLPGSDSGDSLEWDGPKWESWGGGGCSFGGGGKGTYPDVFEGFFLEDENSLIYYLSREALDYFHFCSYE